MTSMLMLKKTLIWKNQNNPKTIQRISKTNSQPMTFRWKKMKKLKMTRKKKPWKKMRNQQSLKSLFLSKRELLIISHLVVMRFLGLLIPKALSLKKMFKYYSMSKKKKACQWTLSCLMIFDQTHTKIYNAFFVQTSNTLKQKLSFFNYSHFFV